MAEPGHEPTATTFLSSIAARLAAARAAFVDPASAPTPSSSTALVKIRTPHVARTGPIVTPVAATPEKRVTGFNAGLPQSALQDPNNPIATGAIPLRGESPSDYVRNGTAVRRLGFEQHPVVQACVRAIVDIASAVPLQVYKKKPAKKSSAFSDDIEVMTSDHPLQQLLDAPNSFLSAMRFRAFMIIHYVIYGNSFTYLERPLPSNGANTQAQGYIPPAPLSLRIVQPEDVYTVYVNAKGYPLWYLWRDTLGYPHTSPVQDLLHIRDLNARGFVFGYPRAAAALSDIIGDNEASEFVRQMVTNSGQAGVWLLANSETTVEEAQKVESQLYEQFITRGQRGRIKVLGGITDVKAVAFSLRDLEFPDLRAIAREDICAAFGVDPRMIGIGSAVKDGGLSGVQYVEARVRLVKHTIEPIMQAVESEMNLWLAPEFGDVYIRFNPDALAQLTEDKQATSTRVLAEMEKGARTVEETREALDLPPEFDDDDLLATAMGIQIVPVAVALQPPTPEVELNPDGTPKLDADGNTIPKTPTAPGATAAPADDSALTAEDEGTTSTAPKKTTSEKDLQATSGTDPNDPGNTPKINDGNKDPEPKKRAERAVMPASRVLVRGVVLTESQRVMLWQQFDVRAMKDESVYRRQAMILFGEERANANRVFDHQGAGLGEDPTDEQTKAAVKGAQRQLRRMYLPDGEVHQRWVDKFHPLIGETYGKGAQQVIDGVNKNRSSRAKPKKDDNTAAPTGGKTILFDWHLQNPAAQAAVRERATRLAKYVGKTTGQIISDAIEVGLRDSMSVKQIAKLVDQTAFGTGASYRSVMIARTETVGALNQGEFDTATETQVIAGKEWLTQGDDRVRDSHYDCEAEGMIALDDQFESNGLLRPGDPAGDAEDVINCRCTLLYYDELDEGASSIENAGGAQAEVAP